MAMSKKVYIQTAKVMQRVFESVRLYKEKDMSYKAAQIIFADAIQGMADIFAADNRNFDRKMFIRACAELTEQEQEYSKWQID